MKLEQILKCPFDHSSLEVRRKGLFCQTCQRSFQKNQYGVYNFLPQKLKESGSDWQPGQGGWEINKLLKLFTFGWGGRPKREKGVVLDVGCGSKPTGDINLDVYLPDPIPQNFVLARASKLPFLEDSFDVVRSAYVIEHVLNPAQMIKEHVRVAKDKVIIYTDNCDWFGNIFMRLIGKGSIFHQEHYFKWSKEYLCNLINRLGFNCEVTYKDYSHALISKIFSWFGYIPGLKPFFFRDLKAVIYCSKKS